MHENNIVAQMFPSPAQDGACINREKIHSALPLLQSGELLFLKKIFYQSENIDTLCTCIQAAFLCMQSVYAAYAVGSKGG